MDIDGVSEIIFLLIVNTFNYICVYLCCCVCFVYLILAGDGFI